MIERIKQFVKSFDARIRFFNSISAKSRVLDLGCGSGQNASTLKNLVPDLEIHGVDLIPTVEVPDFVIYANVDLDQGVLPYPDSHFDAVLLTHVLEHMHSPFRLGREINRVMKKGARIYIEAPNWTTILIPSFGFHREQHIPFNFYDDPTHLKPWSKHGLLEFLVQGCRLKMQSLGTVRNWVRIPFDLVRILIGLVSRNRIHVVSGFWNLYGWAIYAIGVKEGGEKIV